MNKQREAVYGMRRKLLAGKDQRDHIMGLIGDLAGDAVESRCPERTHPDTWDMTGLRTDIANSFGVNIDNLDLNGLDRQATADEITETLSKQYEEERKEQVMGAERLRYSERMIMLQLLDAQWKDHLLSMDHLKEGITLRSYGQRDPLVEYKKESFQLFQDMMARFEEETLRFMFHLQPAASSPERARREAAPVGSVGNQGRGACFKPEPGRRYDRGLHTRRTAQEREGAGARAYGWSRGSAGGGEAGYSWERKWAATPLVLAEAARNTRSAAAGPPDCR